MSAAAIAVLTGDLVASAKRSSDQIALAMRAIEAAAERLSTWHSPAKDTRFTRYRGDGWQMVIAEPQYALRAAVVIQGKLIAIGMESRIFAGIGKYDSLGSSTLADASGEAFVRSGQGLDSMGDAWRIGIDKEGIRPEDQMIADLLGERMGRWTAAQAEAAAMQLASPLKITTLFEIGKELNISPQAVNDRVRGAGCATISSVLRRWERLKVQQGWGTTE